MKESIKIFFTDTIGRLIDYFILNVVFIITCLPVITIGTSCTAMYYVMFHIMEEEDLHLLRKYFKTWKECFGKSTLVWVLSLIVYFLLYLAVSFLAGRAMNTMTIFFYAMILILFFFISSMLIYYFSLHARFENTISVTLKNACILMISNLPVSFLCFVIMIIPPFIFFMTSFQVAMIISSFILLFGFALQARLQSHLLLPIYKTLTPEEGIE